MAAQTGKIIYKVAFVTQKKIKKKKEKGTICSLIPKGSVSEQMQQTKCFHICQSQRRVLNVWFLGFFPTGALGEHFWFEGDF